MRILFITSTRVGDAILSMGVLDHLIKQHPGAKITVACGPAAASLFDAIPGLQRIVVLDKMPFSLHWLRLWALSIGTFWGAVVDLRRSPMSYVLMTRKNYRLGRGKPGVHRIRQLAEVLGLADNPPAPKLWLSDATKTLAAELIPDGPPVLAIGPTANWRAKTWRAEHFSELTKRLTGADGILPGGRIALFGRDDERPSVMGLIEDIPTDQRIDLIGRLDLLQAAACLGRCQFYVGNDSGLMHLAAAAGIPTLGLFGPSPKVHYAPWSGKGGEGDHCAVVSTSIPYEEIFPENFDHINSDTLMDSLSIDAAEQGARDLFQRLAP
ncbi:MAG: glycosyltransferase family 9 protein [Rhodospirillaceae bacterium]|jgi:heptosyltransferase III|nr:glycosyltransferase family 9 protein [Rhodospirillaceae bacterium]MBT4464389.1 glycosyltransferase family 9 protein [Rhodospirillaceae bacterium]MBT5308940.1 glycosyltransferase family 9 protein [Rhodospirillaceae bacterium]MBT6406687.1 glycosyltransferase family 9 protein [Rhodospirillaceae bacterium]MBT7356706.1 glycosyltransferase family 9 protein [Rhodospirillaceae bacterium]